MNYKKISEAKFLSYGGLRTALCSCYRNGIFLHWLLDLTCL